MVPTSFMAAALIDWMCASASESLPSSSASTDLRAVSALALAPSLASWPIALAFWRASASACS